jgi:hypothetical protein
VRLLQRRDLWPIELLQWVCMQWARETSRHLHNQEALMRLYCRQLPLVNTPSFRWLVKYLYVATGNFFMPSWYEKAIKIHTNTSFLHLGGQILYLFHNKFSIKLLIQILSPPFLKRNLHQRNRVIKIDNPIHCLILTQIVTYLWSGVMLSFPICNNWRTLVFLLFL